MKTRLYQMFLMIAALVVCMILSIKKFAIDVAEKGFIDLTKLMHRQGLILMATVYSDMQTTINGPAFGQPLATRVKANKLAGRIREFESTYTVPVGGQAVGDKIVWGKLPVKARPLGHLGQLSFSAGAATSTLNLGDNVSAARHLAATSVAAAGTAVPSAALASGATFETSDDSNTVGNGFASATDDSTLTSVVGTAALAAGQVITLRMPYVTD